MIKGQNRDTRGKGNGKGKPKLFIYLLEYMIYIVTLNLINLIL